MKKIWVIVSVLVALGLLVGAIAIGCTKVTKTAVSGGSEYFPHEDGYSWTYKRTESTTTKEAVTRYTFNGTASVDSISVQIWEHELYADSSSPIRYSFYLIVTDAAVLQYGWVQNPNTNPTTYLAFPLEVGKSWMTGSAQVVAIETVTVPAGTFNNCFKISNPSTGFEYSYTWLAPNVGEIKRAESYQGHVVVEELTSKNF